MIVHSPVGAEPAVRSVQVQRPAPIHRWRLALGLDGHEFDPLADPVGGQLGRRVVIHAQRQGSIGAMHRDLVQHAYGSTNPRGAGR